MMSKRNQDVVARYRSASDEELMRIAASYDGLTGRSQTALREEFSSRGLQPPLARDVENFQAAELVTIATFRDMPEAFVTRSVLEAVGIPCVLRDENTVRMDWLLANVIGGMRLQVSKENVEAAIRALAMPPREELAEQSGRDFLAPTCPECGSSVIRRYDPARKAAGASLASAYFLGILLPFWRASVSDAWRCDQCGCRWVEDDGAESGA